MNPSGAHAGTRERGMTMQTHAGDESLGGALRRVWVEYSTNPRGEPARLARR
jgi:hypothetical protein